MTATLPVSLAELSFFLGGVLPRKAQILLYGQKGSGKSTVAVQVGAAAESAGLRVGCILTEQSAEEHAQLLRSLGISPSRFEIREVSDPTALIPIPGVDVMIVDSINGLGQVRRQAEYARLLRFIQLCKRRGITTILVSHATKAGDAAGPSGLQHAVDAVVRMIPTGAYHVLQIEKRRRLGAWAGQAMPKDVPLVLSSRGFAPSPFAEPIVATAGGFARERLVGVQALISLPPRRLHSPFLPARRVRQLLSTLQQHAGINVDPEQVGLSVLADGPYAPSLDLALAVAITASYRRQPVPANVVFIGGVGLNGMIQPLADDGPAVGVALADTSVRLFVSSSSEGLIAEMLPSSVHVVGVSSLSECLAQLKL